MELLLGAQHLAYQMVGAESGPLIIESHQEQMGRIDAAQQRRRVRLAVTAAHASAVSSDKTGIGLMAGPALLHPLAAHVKPGTTK
jgi:hypothetical protein